MITLSKNIRPVVETGNYSHEQLVNTHGMIINQFEATLHTTQYDDDAGRNVCLTRLEIRYLLALLYENLPKSPR